MSESAPIFVVGTSRSGTTLLRMMLCAHPRIHLTMEASFYVWGGLYPAWRDPDAFPLAYLRTFSFRWLRLDPEAVLKDLPRPFGRRDRRTLYEAVMRTQAHQHGKVRFGDKTPGHSGRLSAIFADWPDAKVVRMLRDPREVVGSLVKMPWASRSLVAGAAITDLERRQIRPFKERILEVGLTELLREPEPTLRRVLAFVGEPWSDQVLDHPAHAPDDLPPLPWFRSASGERIAPAGPPRNLDPVAVRLLEILNRRALAEQGLGPLDLPTEPSRIAIARRYLADLPETARSAGIAMRLVGASMRAADHQETQALLRRLNPTAWDALGPDFSMPEPPLPLGWEQAWIRP